MYEAASEGLEWITTREMTMGSSRMTSKVWRSATLHGYVAMSKEGKELTMNEFLMQ